MGRQKAPKSDFQSQFFISKIVRIFLGFFWGGTQKTDVGVRRSKKVEVERF